MNQDIPTYQPHPGTIKVSGGTDVRAAAKCALFFLNKQVAPHIDFFYIGASAGQQAMKAMVKMKEFIEAATEGKSTVLFQPHHVQTPVTEPDNSVVMKYAVFWRAHVLRTQGLSELLLQYGYTEPIRFFADSTGRSPG